MAEVEAVATGNSKFGISLYNMIKQENNRLSHMVLSKYLPLSCLENTVQNHAIFLDVIVSN
jgi:hypothetical protein